jgi:serine/threonine-protein kinase
MTHGSASRGENDRSVTGVRQSKPAPAPGRYEPGRLIAEKYRLIRPLRVGGMGTVWVAHNRVLDVDVGIKLIELHGDEGADLAQRLLDEARAAARLGHEGIVRVTDFGVTRLGDPFLAMELLEGEDLADLLAREGRLQGRFAVRLLLPIVGALAAAHDKGIVHRDVKPENIFLAKEGADVKPKLLDFGIARTLYGVPRTTSEGVVMGTPDYMSPEQARGEETDASSDVWSTCVVLYELVAGACPFSGANPLELLRAIAGNEPVSFEQRAIDEPDLYRIIERGLQKQSKERWNGMRALGEVLALYLTERGVAEDVSGTSLRYVWLSGLMPPLAHPANEAMGGGEARSATTTAEAPPPAPSGPDLEALAAVNAGGDPVEQLERAERRRTAAWIVAVALLVAASTLGILIGTGIVVF